MYAYTFQCIICYSLGVCKNGDAPIKPTVCFGDRPLFWTYTKFLTVVCLLNQSSGLITNRNHHHFEDAFIESSLVIIEMMSSQLGLNHSPLFGIQAIAFLMILPPSSTSIQASSWSSSRGLGLTTWFFHHQREVFPVGFSFNQSN